MTEQLETYCENLKNRLLALCTAKGILQNQLLVVEDLDEKWRISAPQYMADAVPEIKDYPTVAIAWACYYGMGAAALWDAAWDSCKDIEDLYTYIRDKRGFDLMDEYVTEELLGLDNVNAKQLSNFIGDCSTLALTLLRKEGIEPQSIEAFHLFAKTTQIFFQMGVSIELHRMGYKYEKITFN